MCLSLDAKEKLKAQPWFREYPGTRTHNRKSRHPLPKRSVLDGNDFDFPRAKKKPVTKEATTLEEMETIYISCYGEKPSRPICYYGGEFIALRADLITGVTREFPLLWQHNFNLPPDVPRLHEEAHMFSLLAERLRFRNNLGNQFTKRMWTGKAYNNVCPAMRICLYGIYLPKRSSDYTNSTSCSCVIRRYATKRTSEERPGNTVAFHELAYKKKPKTCCPY